MNKPSFDPGHSYFRTSLNLLCYGNENRDTKIAKWWEHEKLTHKICKNSAE